MKNTRHAVPVLVLLLVCAAVYWVGLGSGGFHSTEAHRVIPAYEMLDHGHWLVPRMFGQPYLRKPPGMPWAVAAMSEILGRNVFAARAVSALSSTAMALIAFWAGRRWFGPRAALAAGLAQALMPVLFESGRAAEIEALNNLGTQIAVFLLIDALVFAHATRSRVVSAIGAAVGVVWFMLAKGPASAPVVVAVIASACVVMHSTKPLRGVVWITIGLGGATVALLGWMIARAAALEPLAPVVQSPDAFMFEPGRLLGVATLLPVSFAQSLPVSLALLFPWGRDAKVEAGEDRTPLRVASALAWGWVIAVVLYMAMGVRNPRYTLPAAILISPLAGYVVAGVGSWLTPKRERIAMAMLLGRVWVWPVVLLVVAGIYIGVIEAGRRATSGREIGDRLGASIAAWSADEHVDGPVTLLADHLIEARPEVLLAAESAARLNGCADFTVLWIPGLEEKGEIEARNGVVLLALRDDDSSREAARLAARLGVALKPLMVGDSPEWDVHKYSFQLYLMKE